MQAELEEQRAEGQRRQESYIRREDRLLTEIAQHKDHVKRLQNEVPEGTTAPDLQCAPCCIRL